MSISGFLRRAAEERVRQLPADRTRQLIPPGAAGTGCGLGIDFRHDQPLAEQASLSDRHASRVEDGAVAIAQPRGPAPVAVRCAAKTRLLRFSDAVLPDHVRAR